VPDAGDLILDTLCLVPDIWYWIPDGLKIAFFFRLRASDFQHCEKSSNYLINNNLFLFLRVQKIGLLVLLIKIDIYVESV